MAFKVVVLAMFLGSSVSLGQDKKPEGHCEKVKDGKHIDLEAPDGEADPKNWCKQQGGKWQKGKKHDDHGEEK